MDREFSIGPDGIFLPFPPAAIGTTLWMLGTLGAGLALFLFVVYRLLPRLIAYRDQALDRLDYGDALPKPVALVLGLLWVVLFVTLTVGVFYTIARLFMLGLARDAEQALDLRWSLLTLTATTATLGAVVALPMTLVRVSYARRQTRTAEENLTTDLINKAVEGLGAQKEVNRLGRTYSFETPNGLMQKGFQWKDEDADLPQAARVPENSPPQDWQNVAITAPNIEVRIGAIYSLERIARDRAEKGKEDGAADHVRIMEILCAYVRENAPAHGAQDHNLGEWPDYSNNATAEDSNAHSEKLVERAKALGSWCTSLLVQHAPRADIQAALEVIGRRNPKQIIAEKSQRHRQSDQTYRLDFRNANLQGADLSQLNLDRALLSQARLEGADLTEARLEGADLTEARLEGADLTEARLETANLLRARLDMAVLNVARLEGANLFGARMELADLTEARLEGADLCWAQFSVTSLFKPATLRGAGLKAVNVGFAVTDFDALPQLLAEAFGDASVILPNGLEAGAPPLEHWSTEDFIRFEEFDTAWRAHQAAIGYTPPD